MAREAGDDACERYDQEEGEQPDVEARERQQMPRARAREQIGQFR